MTSANIRYEDKVKEIPITDFLELLKYLHLLLKIICKTAKNIQLRIETIVSETRTNSETKAEEDRSEERKGVTNEDIEEKGESRREGEKNYDTSKEGSHHALRAPPKPLDVRAKSSSVPTRSPQKSSKLQENQNQAIKEECLNFLYDCASFIPTYT